MVGIASARQSSAEESQKVHVWTPGASTVPHCEHIVFTGGFCAADALTPVRGARSEYHFPARGCIPTFRYAAYQLAGRKGETRIRLPAKEIPD